MGEKLNRRLSDIDNSEPVSRLVAHTGTERAFGAGHELLRIGSLDRSPA
jgi:hypothetical protein